MQGVKIMFDSSVTIVKSSPRLDAMILLSNIGGILGLTLGYSILDIANIGKIVEGVTSILKHTDTGMDPGGGMGGMHPPPPPDPRLLKGMP